MEEVEEMEEVEDGMGANRWVFFRGRKRRVNRTRRLGAAYRLSR